MSLLAMTQRATAPLLEAAADPTWMGTLASLYDFLSPYNEFVAILFVLWLFARRGRPEQGDFNRQAQEILESKYRSGELSRKAYEKFRQDISLRPKR